jgi:hypothetical protein
MIAGHAGYLLPRKEATDKTDTLEQWYSTFFVRVPPDIISLQLYTPNMGEERKVYKVLVGKPEGKRPLGRPRRRCEDGIGMDLKEIGLGGVDWIRLSQDRDRWRAVVSAVMNLRVLAPRS